LVEGEKGKLTLMIPELIEVETKEGRVLVSRRSEAKKIKSCHGTVRSLLSNMILGVTEGWTKSLDIVGTGYRASRQGNEIQLAVGFSHSVNFKIPEGIEAQVEENKIVLTGIDKQLVGETAAQLRRIRPPDAYKGKGIRYTGEEIKLKPGKAAKTGAGE